MGGREIALVDNTALEVGALMEETAPCMTSRNTGEGKYVAEMLSPPSPGSMRILYNNCNGLQMNEYIKNKLIQKYRNKTRSIYRKHNNTQRLAYS